MFIKSVTATTTGVLTSLDPDTIQITPHSYEVLVGKAGGIFIY